MREYKRLTIGKYLVVQNAENGHIIITSDDGFYFHASQNRLLTEKELENYLDFAVNKLPSLLEVKNDD